MVRVGSNYLLWASKTKAVLTAQVVQKPNVKSQLNRPPLVYVHTPVCNPELS